MSKFYVHRLEILEKAYQSLLEICNKIPGHNEKKLQAIEILSNYLWLVHSGRFYSAFVEDEIKQIALEFKHNETVNKNEKQAIFIATELYRTGGHTRILEHFAGYLKKWGFKTELIVSNQTSMEIPERIYKSQNFNLIEGIGEIKDFKRIANISEKIATAGLVYNFQHPNDICTSVALEINKNLYHNYVNHADHRFFTGFDTANNVIHTRKYAQNLHKNRRSKSNEGVIIPVAVPPNNHGASKDLARGKLGLAPTDILLITVSSFYKLIPNETYNMFEIIKRVISENKNIKWLIVGITEVEYIKLSNASIPERVICYGEIENIATHLSAADFFIEGMPVGSTTAMFEAVEAGCFPIFTWGPEFPVSSKNDEPYIEELIQHSTSKEQFFQNVNDIILNFNVDNQYCKSIVYEIQKKIRYYSDEQYLYKHILNNEIKNQVKVSNFAVEFQKGIDDIGQCKWDYNHYSRTNKEPIIEALQKLTSLFYPGRKWIAKHFIIFFNASFNKRLFVINYLKLLRLNIIKNIYLIIKNYYSEMPESSILKKQYKIIKNILSDNSLFFY